MRVLYDVWSHQVEISAGFSSDREADHGLPVNAQTGCFHLRLTDPCPFEHI